DDAPGRPEIPADAGDAAVADGDIGPHRLGARTVDNRAALNDRVEHGQCFPLAVSLARKLLNSSPTRMGRRSVTSRTVSLRCASSMVRPTLALTSSLVASVPRAQLAAILVA